MDRFKELGIDTHGRTSGKMKTKCPWCHAQRTDKRDKSLSVNLDTKLYLCHYCGAHGSAAIYAGKGRKLGDPLVKFPTATGSNSSCPPTEKPHGDLSKGHSHRSKLNGVVTSATFRRKYWWKLAWLSPPSRCLYPERRKAGKRGTVSASTFSKTGNW